MIDKLPNIFLGLTIAFLMALSSVLATRAVIHGLAESRARHQINMVELEIEAAKAQAELEAIRREGADGDV